MIIATGRIKNNTYEKDGVKRYTTDIVIESFEFAGGSSNSDSNSFGGNDFPETNPFEGNVSEIETTDIEEDPYKDFGEEVNISSDDLPF